MAQEKTLQKKTNQEQLTAVDNKKPRPNPKDFLTNISGPMPLAKKLGLLFRNNLYKLRNSSSCCGHPGEPGC